MSGEKEARMPEQEQERTLRPFPDVLRDLRRGALLDELSAALADVVAGVEEHGGTGKLTLQLTIKPEGHGAVIVKDVVKADIPAAAKAGAIMFAHKGVLTRNDPRQPELGLRSVDDSKEEAKSG